MRILYLAHRVPFPPNKGEKIRAFHQLRALSARSHHIDLFAFGDHPDDLRHEGELRRFCASVTLLPLRAVPAGTRVLRALPSRTSLTVAYFDSVAMHAAVGMAVQRTPPDAVVACSSSMVQYVRRELRARTVIDLIDVDSEKWREYSQRASFPKSVVYAIEARRLRRYEHWLAQEFPHVLLTTSREVEVFGSLHADRLQVLSGGVDIDYFQPRVHDDAAPPELVFTGVMDYFPNVDAVQWFVREVWPALAHVPGLRFTIVGSRPSPAVQALARVPGITVTGAVPDVRPYLQRAAVVVVPLRVARGMQNKVLEAMASGVPVVATPATVEAFNTGDIPVRVASEPCQFADMITSLLDDARARATLGRAARAFVERHYRWEPILDQFCQLVESTAIGAV